MESEGAIRISLELMLMLADKNIVTFTSQT